MLSLDSVSRSLSDSVLDVCALGVGEKSLSGEGSLSLSFERTRLLSSLSLSRLSESLTGLFLCLPRVLLRCGDVFRLVRGEAPLCVPRDGGEALLLRAGGDVLLSREGGGDLVRGGGDALREGGGDALREGGGDLVRGGGDALRDGGGDLVRGGGDALREGEDVLFR